MSTYTCVVCNEENDGGVTRKICADCKDIPRYCKCGCNTKLSSSVYAGAKFAPGHNVYLQSKEEIVNRGKKGHKKSMDHFPIIKKYTCRVCNEEKEETLTRPGPSRKTCEACQDREIICACGCGTVIKSDKHHQPKYAVGHNTRALTFEEQKRRNAKRLSHHKYDDEFRKKMSEKIVRLHKEGKFLNLYGSNNKSSKVELSLKPVLEPLGYVSTQDKKYHIGNSKIGVHIPDYVNRSERKIVEVWGTYWHRGENPQDLIDWYAEQGWTAQVVWENEVPAFAVNMGGV